MIGSSLLTQLVQLWRKVRDRSPMWCVNAEQVFELAKASSFTRSPELLYVVRQQWLGLTQTKLIEDSFREQRAGEVSRSFKKSMSGERCWATIIDSKIEKTRHRYESLDWESQPLPRGVKDTSASGLFKPKPKDVPKAYRAIVNTAGKAPYPTLAANLSVAPHEDRELLQYCRQRACMELGGQRWLSILASETMPQLVSCQELAGNKWFVSCGTGGGSCCVGIPVESIQWDKNELFYQVRTWEINGDF